MSQIVNGSGSANVIDPDANVCANCAHAFMQRLPPPNLGTVNVCKMLPPSPMAMRDMRNQIVGFASASPIVADTDFCSHFDRRKIPGAESQASNDETKLPPGKIVS